MFFGRLPGGFSVEAGGWAVVDRGLQAQDGVALYELEQVLTGDWRFWDCCRSSDWGLPAACVRGAAVEGLFHRGDISTYSRVFRSQLFEDRLVVHRSLLGIG